MRRAPRLATAFAVMASIAGFAACSTTTKIDPDKAAALVQSQVHGGTVKVDSVTCPSGITAKTGGTFDCTITFANGTTATTGVKMTDDKGDVETIGGLKIIKK